VNVGSNPAAGQLTVKLHLRARMKGDYHRYISGFKTISNRKNAEEHTLLAYKAAQVSTAAGGRRLLLTK
jgi:hypothetical protein